MTGIRGGRKGKRYAVYGSRYGAEGWSAERLLYYVYALTLFAAEGVANQERARSAASGYASHGAEWITGVARDYEPFRRERSGRP